MSLHTVRDDSSSAFDAFSGGSPVADLTDPPDPCTGGSAQAGSIEQTLDQLGALAGRSIAGALGVNVTFLDPHRPNRPMGSTAPFLAEIEQLQYVVEEGPAIDAARSRRSVVSGSLGEDDRWPEFASLVERFAMQSVLSQPLVASGRLVGVMTLYARNHDAFDGRAVHEADVFAGPAAIAVSSAQPARTASSSPSTMSVAGQDAVERAIGIMMGRHRCTQERAMNRLMRMSEHEQLQLAVMAQQIVDEAVGAVGTRYIEVREPSRPYGAKAPAVVSERPDAARLNLDWQLSSPTDRATHGLA